MPTISLYLKARTYFAIAYYAEKQGTTPTKFLSELADSYVEMMEKEEWAQRREGDAV